MTLLTLVVPAVLEAFSIPQSQAVTLQQEELSRFMAHFGGRGSGMSPSIDLMTVPTAYGLSPTISFASPAGAALDSNQVSPLTLTPQRDSNSLPLSKTESNVLPLTDSFSALSPTPTWDVAAAAGAADVPAVPEAEAAGYEPPAGPPAEDAVQDLPAAFSLRPVPRIMPMVGARSRLASGASGVSAVSYSLTSISSGVRNLWFQPVLPV